MFKYDPKVWRFTVPQRVNLSKKADMAVPIRDAVIETLRETLAAIKGITYAAYTNNDELESDSADQIHRLADNALAKTAVPLPAAE